MHADLPAPIRSDPVWQQRFATFWHEVNLAAKQAEEAAATAKVRQPPPADGPEGKRLRPNPVDLPACGSSDPAGPDGAQIVS